MPNTDHFSFAITAIGHISFGLTFLSYAQSDIIRLRMIAIASLSCGLLYNGWIQSRMTGEDDIWLVVFWLAVFLAQNIFLLVNEIRSELEVRLPTQSKILLSNVFPDMHSRDWLSLVALATVKQHAKGEIILDIGQPTNSLSMIVSGQAQEVRGCDQRLCEKGTLWGELTFVLGENSFNASPVKISVISETMTTYSWPYETLRKHLKKNHRLNAALQHGFVCSAGLKHGLLWLEKSPIRPALPS